MNVKPNTKNTRVVLFDMMDTLLAEPYFKAVDRLLPVGVSRSRYFALRDRNSYLAFERGEICEREHFASFYIPDGPNRILESLPKPRRLVKELLKLVHPLEGILPLIAHLRGLPGVRLGIASNYSTWYSHFERLFPGIFDPMDYLFFSCEMNVRKPDPVFFRTIEQSILKRSDLRPAFFFADDRPENVEAARSVGWTAHLMTDVDSLVAEVRLFVD